MNVGHSDERGRRRDVAALIVEPVLGESGVVVPPDDYLPALKRRCEKHRIVLIVNEVQTGFGRGHSSQLA